MEILRRPIHEITFEDIVDFCQEGFVEGIQLDYKKDLSEKGLSKHFAAFSNARGGLIIVGVEEDSKIGKPTKWEGVDPAGKLEDRIHQQAANVDPMPRYEVVSTNADASGKVFILVRILEGDRTPYYVLNDATLRIRTGNVTNNCIEQASPQETARLFAKRDDARLVRAINLERAEKVYQSAIDRLQYWKKRWLATKGKNAEMTPVSVPHVGVLTLKLQPTFPALPLTSPRHLMTIVKDLRHRRGNEESWIRDSKFESMQDGVLCIDSITGGNTALYECQEFFASGLIFGRRSISFLLAPLGSSEEEVIGLETFFINTYSFLTMAQALYQDLGYQGGLIGQIELTELEGLKVTAFTSANGPYYPPRDILMSSYVWPISLDTSILLDSQSLKEFFTELVNEICWSFGWDFDHTEILNHYIESNRWFAE